MDQETIQTLRVIVDLITAASAAVAAASSMINRGKLKDITVRVDRAVIVAAETKREAVKKTEEVKAAVEEVKEATLAVNAEVVRQVHVEGVEAGKAIANNSNGKH